MNWAGLVTQYRIPVTITAAGLGHVAVAGLVLALPTPVMSDTVVVLPVELVILPPPEPKPEPELQPEDVPDSDRPSAPEPELAPGVQAQGPDPAASDTPFVSLSDEREVEERVVPPRSSGSNQMQEEGGKAAEMARGVRVALRRVACRKLVEKPDPTCPKGDPFYEKEQVLALRNTPPVRRIGVGPPRPGSYAEAFLARNSGWPPKMLGGEDNSIFIDPMQQGAYNAQRIRNGKTPIWSPDLQRDLEHRRGG
ncbi:MAG: hypothetical protein L3J02_05080 [Henriciella sp.]|nr:hypothetical protein [Henriciella sp.]